MITISFIPILAAGIVSVFTGFVWYHPKVFGTAYKRLSGTTLETDAASTRGTSVPLKKNMPMKALASVLASMLIAWVMVFVGNALNEFVDWIGAVELGFWIWAGFVAPVMFGMVLWEHKSFKLYLIKALHWLVALVLMALVLLIGSQYFSGVANSYSTGVGTQQIIE